MARRRRTRRPQTDDELIVKMTQPDEVVSGEEKLPQIESSPWIPVLDLGRWILADLPEDISASYLQLRRVFRIEWVARVASIAVASTRPYVLYVNGSAVGHGPLPGVEDYAYIDRYDLAGILKRGSNTVAFLVSGDEESSDSPGLVCEIVVETSRTTYRFSSGTEWEARWATEWAGSGNHNAGFDVDLTECELSFSDAEWHSGKGRAKAWGLACEAECEGAKFPDKLLERKLRSFTSIERTPTRLIGVFQTPVRSRDLSAAELVDVMRADVLVSLGQRDGSDHVELISLNELEEVKTGRSAKGVVLVFDFGGIVCGYPEIELDASGAGTLDVSYGSAFDRNLKNINACDRVLVHKGAIKWQSMRPRTFRYIQIEFRKFAKSVVPRAVRAVVFAWDLPETGSFECSDRVLNELYSSSVAAARVLTGTAVTKKSDLWGLRSGLAMLCGVRGIHAALGDDSALAQAVDVVRHSTQVSIPSILAVFDYCFFTMDMQTAAELYPRYRSLMRECKHLAANGGFLSLRSDSGSTQSQIASAEWNALYYHSLRIASALASISGAHEDAVEHELESVRLRDALNTKMLDQTVGLYADVDEDGRLALDFATIASILAALYDVADPYTKSAVVHALREGRSAPDLDSLETLLLAEAMCAAGDHEDCCTLLHARAVILANEESATLESFCALAGVAHTLISEIAGLKPVFGVADRYSVTPHPSGLDSARAVVITARGKLGIEWRLTKRSFALRMLVPEGTRVDVYVPGECVAGLHVDGKAVPGRVVTVGTGEHEIKAAVSTHQGPVISVSKDHYVGIPQVVILEDVSQLGLSSGRRRRRWETLPGSVADSDETTEATESLADDYDDTEEEITASPVDVGPAVNRSRSRKMSATAEHSSLPDAVDFTPLETPDELDKPLLEELSAPSKVRRRRRPRRRTAPKVTGVEQSELQTSGDDDIDAQSISSETTDAFVPVEGLTEPAEVMAEETVATTKSRRRRRPRRRSASTVNEAITEPVQDGIQELSGIDETYSATVTSELSVENVVEVPRSRTRRPELRPSSDVLEMTADTEHDVLREEVMAAPSGMVEKSLEPSEGDDETPPKSRRRRRPRRRRSSAVQDGQAIGEHDSIEPTIAHDVSTQPFDVESQMVSEDNIVENELEKPRRRYRSRRRKAPLRAVDTAEGSSDDIA